MNRKLWCLLYLLGYKGAVTVTITEQQRRELALKFATWGEDGDSLVMHTGQGSIVFKIINQ